MAAIGDRPRSLRRRWARANHVLIPETAAERDRLRRSWIGRFFGLVFAFAERVSSEGGPFLLLAGLSSLAALDVMRTQIYVAWGALAGLLVASLAWSTAYRLVGVRANVLVPRRVVQGTPTTFAVILENEGEREHASLRVRGPFLPWDGTYSRRPSGVARLPAGGRARVEAELVFQSRGAHHLDTFSVQALVPLGLALGPPTHTDEPRFLVVPKVARVAGLTLPRARRHHPGGVPRAVHTADSRELAGVRPYRAGDPVRDLHVRTWARTGQPFVREYQEEYFAHVLVVVDASARAEAPSKPRSRFARARAGEDDALEGALSVAAGVVAKIVGGEALIDLAVTGDAAAGGVGAGVPLGRGRGTLDAALDRLATVERGAPLDVAATAAALVRDRDRISSIVLVLSAADEARAALVRELRAEGLAIVVAVVTDAGDGAVEGATSIAATAVLAGEVVSL